MKMVSGNPKPLLKPGEVHVWLFDLDGSGQSIPEWERLLSGDETIRSKLFRFERDRLRFVARRGILRQLLGQYTGLDPAQIAYHINPYGKLSLPSHPLQFNISGCQERVAFAFALENEVGVDLEQIHPIPELDRIAERWFSPAEWAGMSALAPGMRMEAFFHIWTQKEAFLKARGEGLYLQLSDFSVSVDPKKVDSLLSINCASEDASHWKMVSHVPEPGWRLAVCLHAEMTPIVRWYMPDQVRG